MRLRQQAEILARIVDVEGLGDIDLAHPIGEPEADDLAARLIRHHSVRYNGITHHQAIEFVRLFFE
jgi:hypothetical protein